MDDTPPFLMNQQALDVAIEQCLMLGCDIIDEVHIARKQYLGRQHSDRVSTHCDRGHERTGSLSRSATDRNAGKCRRGQLSGSSRRGTSGGVADRPARHAAHRDGHGTGTGHPDEVEEAILLIGRVCRSTRHVRTGPGASRQDVNVSVRGGRRVEIKGVPSARLAPALVHGEAWRQVHLLELRDELKRRGEFRIESIEVTEFFTSSGPGFL